MKIWCRIFGHDWLCIERFRGMAGTAFYEWTGWRCGRCGEHKNIRIKTKRGSRE